LTWVKLIKSKDPYYARRIGNALSRGELVGRFRPARPKAGGKIKAVWWRTRFEPVRGGAMFSQRVRKLMERKKLLTASPEITVSAAAKLMATRKVGAVMVVEEQKLVGIFTERDIVCRVIAQERDAQTTRLAEVMTTAPQTIDPENSFGYALLMMQENGFRHVPVVENGKLIGIVSARDALDPELEELLAESERRRQILRERV
jgi:CBS domain-containing protein